MSSPGGDDEEDSRPTRVILERLPSADSKANKEAAALASGRDLEQIEAENEHGRREELRDVVHACSKVVLYAGTLLLLWGAAVVAFHWLASPAWHFLTDAQLERLQAVGAGVITSAFLTGLGQKVLGKLGK